MKINMFMKAVIACIVVLSFTVVYSLDEAYDWLEHTHKVIQKAQYTHRLVLESQDSVRCYLLTNDPSCLVDYNSYYPRIMPTVDELELLTRDNPNQQINVGNFRQLISNKVSFIARTLTLANSGNREEASKSVATKDGEPLSKQIDQQIDIIINEETTLLKNREKKVDTYVWYATWGIPILFVIVIIVSKLDFCDKENNQVGQIK